jgi:glycerol-3-phosphate dehydrogenase
VDDESRERLGGRYGHAARGVLDLAAERPELARRIVPELPDLLAEAPFAVRHEQASSLADVLMRRTRLGLLAAPALTAADAEPPRVVAEAMAPELGWDGARIEQELSDWRELAGAEGIALR